MEKVDIIKLQETEDRSKSNTKKLDEHETRLTSLEKTYSVMEKMDYRMSNVENNVIAIKNDIQKGKEQKRYEMG